MSTHNTYQIKPATMAEWAAAWEAFKKTLAVRENAS